MDPVKEKGAPPVRRWRSSLAVGALAVLALLGVGLAAFVSGCGSGENRSDTPETPLTNEHILLNITVEDATKQTSASRFRLKVPGDSVWTPDLSWGSAGRVFGEYQVGRERVFYVRPDSASGRRIEVPFQMQPDMVSGVASSITRVTVYDDSLVARGKAIPSGRQTFERP